MPLEQLTEVQRIQALASLFPTLRRRPEVIHWDPVALNRWARVASHGERLAVQFILHIWNSTEKWSCGKFDAVEAYHVWDGQHWAAFQTWVESPFNC